ncbi:response regulator transcription factor [Enterococcus sp.]|uniref:response regulator transcription factor n=1 Tax=Enterococcus sp. TaxID=35783 RepID=UPI0029154F6B|nr:response regulator transcription factor [Enterococcus sp.]MDU5336400.1 response regulator transcription factor [Enterococcus sp.]
MERSPKILIVEDDEIIERELSTILKSNHYEVYLTEEYTDIPQFILESEIDLVLLDINLKGTETNGFLICSEIRLQSEVPIIFITSREAIDDEIQGMMLGGDDYIKKPYHISLLLLKIKALLKRSSPNEHQSELRYKGIGLSLAKSAITYQDNTIELTKNELQVLHYLFLHKETIVSRSELIDYLWTNQLYIDDNSLSLTVTRLRKKLQEAGVDGLIQTKYRQGYMI